jgi:hypothetical protein
METKYDAYYERDIPYKMTLDELYQRALERSGEPLQRNEEHLSFTEEDVLAYFRYRGADKVRIWKYSAAPRNIMNIGSLFGMPGLAMVSGESDQKTLCRLYVGGERGRDSSYNPLLDESIVPRDGAWYTAYKIMFTPVWYSGVIDKHYVSDFVSGLREGTYEIWESDDETFLDDVNLIPELPAA